MSNHISEVFKTLVKSKSKEVDLESARILLQNLNFGFLEKRKFKKAVEQLRFLETDAYQDKKKELIAMAQQKLEELISRREFVKKAGMAAAGIAAASVMSGFVKKAIAGGLPTYTIEEAYLAGKPWNGSRSAKKFVEEASIISRSMRIKKYYLDDNYGSKIKAILKNDQKMDFNNLEESIGQHKHFDELRLYLDGYLGAEFRSPVSFIIYPLEKSTIDKIKAL